MANLLRSKGTLSALLLAVALIVALPLLTATPQAAAHPLGNFTINRYSRIEPSPSDIYVRYVIDMAEIPTYQERDKIDVNGDGQLDQSEQATYVQKKAEDLRQNLELKINDSKVELQTAARALSFLPGQGGLPTQRMVIDYTAALPSGGQSSTQDVAYRDRNYSERIGWREIVVQAFDGVYITTSSVPAQDISNQLLAYPKNNLPNPLNVQSASFEFTSAPLWSSTRTNHHVTQPRSSTQLRATRGNPDSTLAQYAKLIAKDKLSVDVIIFALLAAVGFGALHALSPGHGKTIVGAYLVGSRGTWRHALLLALIVTVTHTSSVYALGFATLYLSSFIVPEKLYPWLSIASSGLVLAMGFTLLVTRLRTSRLLNDGWCWLRRSLTPLPGGPQLAFGRAAVSTTHEDDHHHDQANLDHARLREADEPNTQHHGFGPAHSHLPLNDNGSPLTWRGLIGLGIFGGLLPCPSAIVVMLSAIALHRVALGLLLIVAFSFGLAGVLTSIGLLLVYAGATSRRLPLAARLSSRLGNRGWSSLAVRVFPAGSAAAVVVAGLVLTAHGLAQQGFL